VSEALRGSGREPDRRRLGALWRPAGLPVARSLAGVPRVVLRHRREPQARASAAERFKDILVLGLFRFHVAAVLAEPALAEAHPDPFDEHRRVCAQLLTAVAYAPGPVGDALAAGAVTGSCRSDLQRLSEPNERANLGAPGPLGGV